MAKVVDYCIIMEPNESNLQESVWGLLKKGWQPLGGPYVNPTSMGAPMVRQAMVLCQDDEAVVLHKDKEYNIEFKDVVAYPSNYKFQEGKAVVGYSAKFVEVDIEKGKDHGQH